MAGGAPPLPEQWRPAAQSPVAQRPRPEASKLHPTRGQTRPDQAVGKGMERAWLGRSSSPPEAKMGWPALGWIPGQTVWEQRL